MRHDRQTALYDVTRPLSPDLAGWPGDVRCNLATTLAIARGDAVNVSALSLSTHLGTHADAPRHFDEGGATAERLPLAAFLGPATLVDFSHLDGPLTPDHLDGIELGRVQRLLVRTPASALPDGVWPQKIVCPTAAAARRLAEAGLLLFGTDAPSVDPLDSKTLDAHHALHAGGVAILEGLQLRDVPPGDYELIALPLKLAADGAPARAVLRALG